MMKHLWLVFLAGVVSAASAPPDVSKLVTAVLVASPNQVGIQNLSMPTMEISFSWIPPTARTDGTPITGTLTYVIYRGIPGSMNAIDAVQSLNVTWYEPIVWGSVQCFGIVVSEVGVQSVLGPLACVTIPSKGVPNAPAGFKVT
ncbi:MAG TPA: hypothetical protein VN879_15935 [Candidatus Acidoferrales bacterium]|nr:hypothetical protein [Candidatus Acidoferrales bacterium]